MINAHTETLDTVTIFGYSVIRFAHAKTRITRGILKFPKFYKKYIKNHKRFQNYRITSSKVRIEGITIRALGFVGNAFITETVGSFVFTIQCGVSGCL